MARHPAPNGRPPEATPPDADDFSAPLTPSYLLGVYLAVNAVPDLYLLVDGPDCAHMKAQVIQGNHDALSTLTSVSGHHRVANTALHPRTMDAAREEGLLELMGRIARHPGVGALLVTAMPMAAVTAVDYARLCRGVARASAVPVLPVPGLSLSRDWLDGYAEALLALARGLPLPAVEPRPGAVAVVGHLHDRNEGDGAANVAALGELCTAAGGELVSVWPSGAPVAALGRAAAASTVVSLPYGRVAARVLAGRTGARLLELPVPFGWGACEAWVRALAAHLGEADRPEGYLKVRARHVAPRLEWLAPCVLQGRSAAYVGDPHLLPGVRDTLELLGARLALAAVTARPRNARLAPDLGPDTLRLANPRIDSLRRRLHRLASDGGLDIVLTSSSGLGAVPPGVAWLELGFPCSYSHSLFERPRLGFAGLLAFVDDLTNALRRATVEAALRRDGARGGGVAGR